MPMTDRTIAYQGEPGANSHIICSQAYPGWTALPCATFEDAFAAALVEAGGRVEPRGLLARLAEHLDLDEPRNVEGMRRMVIDTVLAFLTSNIAPSGYESYLEATPLPDSEGTGTSDDLYDIY